jgi:hypothetical protein
VEHKGLFWMPGTPTSVSTAGTWKDSTELSNWIQQEVKVQQKRLLAAAAKENGPGEFARALDSMRNAMHSYFRTSIAREAEVAGINEEASNILGFSARAAAISYASANIALAWIGLLSTPATIGINFATQRFILYGSEQVTKTFILKKLAVGIGAAFGTMIAQDWEQAMSADFAALQATNNTPGLIDDSWALFFQALNQSTLQKMKAQYVQQVGNIGQKTSDLWGMKMGDPRLEQTAAQRNQMVAAARGTEQRMANYTPQGGSKLMEGMKLTMKAAAWGLTVKSTLDSLETLKKNWYYQY